MKNKISKWIFAFFQLMPIVIFAGYKYIQVWGAFGENVLNFLIIFMIINIGIILLIRKDIKKINFKVLFILGLLSMVFLLKSMIAFSLLL